MTVCRAVYYNITLYIINRLKRLVFNGTSDEYNVAEYHKYTVKFDRTTQLQLVTTTR